MSRVEHLAERLQNKITVAADGCWLWSAGRDTKGYGVIRWNGRGQKAHRVVYECLVGPVQDGLQLDHLCRVRHCVNPDHLDPVTPAENIRRGHTGLTNKAKTHCPKGHEYTPENTYTYGGKRSCKACALSPERTASRRLREADPVWREARRAYMRDWYAKKRLAK